MRKLKWILVLLVVSLSVQAMATSNLKSMSTKKGKRLTCTLEDTSTAGLGDVKYSILTESKFQEVNGAGWVLLAGQDKIDLGIGSEVSVFDYLITPGNHSVVDLPNVQGFFLRSRDNFSKNRFASLPIGTFQDEDMKPHNHAVDFGILGYGSGPTVNGYLSISGVGNVARVPGGVASTLTNTVGTSETRPKNITVNTFVKVKRNCIDAATKSLIEANTTAIVDLQNFVARNQCDACINLPETTLSELQSKATCFKTEIDLFEGDVKNWSVSCTARTVGYAKKVLMLIGINRDTDDNAWLSHLDNQYPYYNVISVN